ncbi:MAG: phosphatase PAP2 family protein [Planctomycetaceae bacterium]|nr:MAG: phosphatase PAP2 family protein [Planctomycetaceae bacterium]
MKISFSRQIILYVLLLAGVIAVFEMTDIDRQVQDKFYVHPGEKKSARRWLVNKDEPVGKGVFYIGAKALVIVIGITCGVVTVASFIKPSVFKYRRIVAFASFLQPYMIKYRKPCLLMCLSIIFVPLIVAGAKKFTNVHTPSQTIPYGGDRPYVKVMERFPKDAYLGSRGEGYPAGHATGGFAMMMLYFAFNDRRWKILGLLAGLTMGWVMGLYQTLNGQHFLSHTFVTMIASWIVILIIYRLVGDREFLKIGTRDQEPGTMTS